MSHLRGRGGRGGREIVSTRMNACGPQKKVVTTQPPSRAPIHDASRRVRISSQPGTRQADYVGARWREPAPTWAQADQGLTPSAASLGYGGSRNPESSPGVRAVCSTKLNTHRTRPLRFGRTSRRRGPELMLSQGRFAMAASYARCGLAPDEHANAVNVANLNASSAWHCYARAARRKGSRK
jgi:hypothetical protein